MLRHNQRSANSDCAYQLLDARNGERFAFEDDMGGDMFAEDCEHGAAAADSHQLSEERGGPCDPHSKQGETPYKQRGWRPWLAVIGGFLVHLTLGTVYTFGNITPYVTSYIRARSTPSSLTYSDAIWIFAAALMGQGAFMILGGFLVKRIGPRWTTLFGAWLMSFGVLMTYFTIQKSFALAVLTYGFLFGFGVGVAYAPPLAAGMQWLPRRKGLVNGIVVAGFGGGAFVFNQVQTAFINPLNLSPNTTVDGLQYYTDADILNRVPPCFLLLGGCYAVLQFIGAMFITFPDAKAEEYKQLLNDDDDEENVLNKEDIAHMRSAKLLAAHNAKSHGSTHNGSLEDLSSLYPLEVLKTRAFYTLWFMFLFTGQAVVFSSTLYKAFGQQFIKDDYFLAVVGAFASVFNAAGRIMWGWLADRFSFRILMMCLCGSMVVFLMTFIVAQYGKEAMFFIWVCAIFLTFSGNFALFPTATAKSFGQKYVVVNYGMVFTSQMITGPVGAILAQQLLGRLHWFGMFSLISAFSMIGGILAFSFNVKRPDGKDI